MKIKHLIFGLLAMASIFAGCTKQEEPAAAKMTITPDTLTFTATPEAGQTVTVNSTREWKVSNIPDWITVTVNGQSIVDVMQATGEIKVTVTASTNDSTERSASVVFNGGSVANKTLIVKQDGKPVPPTVYNTIAEAKAILGSQTSATLADGFKVKATIVSNKDLDNQTSNKNIFIQDSTAGIAVRLTETSTFAFGDEVEIDLGGQTITTYSGAFQLSNIPVANFTTLSAATTVEAKKVSLADFLANKYEGQYIAIDDVQVADSDLSKTWSTSTAHTSINIVAKSGESFIVFTGKYATSLAVTVAQGSGTIKGVSTINNGTMQLMFAQASDFAGLTGERFKIESKTIAIDKIISDGMTSGSVTVEAKVVETSSKGFILYDGGTKFLYAYTGAAPSVTKDSVYVISGSLTKYNNLVELSKDGLTIEASAKGIADPAEQTPVDLTDPAKATAYAGGNGSEVIKIAGELTKSGNYYNMTMEGVSLKGSIETANTELVDTYVGKKIIVTGYFAGKSSSYLTVVPTKIEEDEAPYLNVSPASQKINYNDTTATVTISTNLAKYSIEISEGASFTELYGVITAKFPANTSITDTKTYTVTVKSEGVADAVATITQAAAPDPSANIKYLTNAEIVDGLKAAYAASSKTGYQEVAITSASGNWNGQMNIGAASGSVNIAYVQIRAKDGSNLKSPVFESNVDKIVLYLSEGKNSGQIRNFYAIPSSTSLPSSGNYNEALMAGYYGTAASTGTPGETVTINFSGDTKDFIIAVLNGASYIDKIDVYLK